MRIDDLLTRRATDIDRDWKDEAIEFLQAYARGQSAKIKDLEAENTALRALLVTYEQEGFKAGEPEFKGGHHASPS